MFQIEFLSDKFFYIFGSCCTLHITFVVYSHQPAGLRSCHPLLKCLMVVLALLIQKLGQPVPSVVGYIQVPCTWLPLRSCAGLYSVTHTASRPGMSRLVSVVTPIVSFTYSATPPPLFSFLSFLIALTLACPRHATMSH